MTSCMTRRATSALARRAWPAPAFHPSRKLPARFARYSTMDAISSTVKGAVDTLSGKPGYQQTDVKDLFGKVCRLAATLLDECELITR
jgi:hypothetical protein